MKKNLKLPKTRYVAYVASSVDGRISLGGKGKPDWTSSDDWKFFQGELTKFEAFVAGRNTFEAVETRLSRRNTFVLSSRVKEINNRGKVSFVNPKTVNLRKLFGQYENVAVLGGATAYQTMLDENLIDEIYVTVEPLIFGRGREMFVGGSKNTRLQLLSSRKLNRQGTILLHYQVLR